MIIPEIDFNLTELEDIIEPSLTYRLNLNTNRIIGKVDNDDAIVQAVLKILNTERYSSVIYSGQYGIELERFIGEDFDFVIADLERTVEEALLADDRIKGIEDFEIENIGKDSLVVSFTVQTIINEIYIEAEVDAI